VENNFRFIRVHVNGRINHVFFVFSFQLNAPKPSKINFTNSWKDRHLSFQEKKRLMIEEAKR